MKLSTLTILATSAISVNAYKLVVWDGPDAKGNHHYEYFSCDAYEGRSCFNIQAPLKDNVWSYDWCPGGEADLTVYDGEDCAGNIVSREGNYLKNTVNTFHGNNRFIKSFRVTGNLNTCWC